MRRLISASAVSVIVFGMAGAVSGVAVATATPHIQPEYVAKYNALCDASITKFQAKLHALGPDHNTDQVVAVIVPIYQDRLDKVRKLVPPTADRKRVEALIAAQQTAIDTVKDDHEVLNGSRADLFSFSEGNKADQVATRYGLESGNCLDASKLGGGSRPCPGVGPCAGQSDQGPPPGGSVPPPPVPPSTPSGAGTVLASQWVTSVCAAEAKLHDTLQGELDAIKSSSDAASQKQGFVDFLSGLPAQVKTLNHAIKKAGIPNVTNGKEISRTYIDTLKAIITKVPTLQSTAEALPTSSKDALQKAGSSIGNALDAIKREGDTKVSSLDSSGMLAPDLGRCGGIFPL